MPRHQDPVKTASNSAILPIPDDLRRRHPRQRRRRIEAPRQRLELPVPHVDREAPRGPRSCEESTARGAVVVDFYL